MTEIISDNKIYFKCKNCNKEVFLKENIFKPGNLSKKIRCPICKRIFILEKEKTYVKNNSMDMLFNTILIKIINHIEKGNKIYGVKDINENKHIAEQVYKKAKDHFEYFFSLIMETDTNKEFYEPMKIAKRFFSNNVNEEERGKMIEMLRISFFTGFVFHFMFFYIPSRDQYNNVDYLKLYNSWLPKTLIANIEMKQYNDESNNLAYSFFAWLYDESEYDKYMKDHHKLPIMKRLNVKSFLKNILCSGCMYGMYYEIATAEE